MAALLMEDVLKAVSDLRNEMQAQVAELKLELEKVRSSHSELITSSPATDTHGVSQETLVIMAAVVTSYLGKKVRIKSARHAQPPSAPANVWAQHGRIVNHVSRNWPRAR